MSPERIKKLESLHGWVWDALDAKWESGFTSLENYVDESGNCEVPRRCITDEGFRLGRWVSRQRGKKDKLSKEQIARLDSLGFVWKVKK